MSIPSMSPKQILSIPTSSKDAPIAPFLISLHKIVTSPEYECIGWAEHGTAIEVTDVDQLKNYVLPKHYKHGRYDSFTRQLNYFGFRKFSKHHKNTFKNIHFNKYNPGAIHHIKRRSPIRKKTNSIKKIAKSSVSRQQDILTALDKLLEMECGLFSTKCTDAFAPTAEAISHLQETSPDMFEPYTTMYKPSWMHKPLRLY